MQAEPSEREPLLVAVSDLHCGSTVGLCPPDCPLLDEGYWGLNPIQREIWGRWLEFWCWVSDRVRGRRWALLLNGDMTEGRHHNTIEIVHADPGVHARIAMMSLQVGQSLVEKQPERIYVVRGTGCHVGHSGEASIGKALGAVESSAGVHARQHWSFRMGGSIVSAKHHIGPTSRRSLRGSQLSINLEEERAEAFAAWASDPQRAIDPMVPDVLIRSHRHVYGCYETEDATMVVTPAWQGLTEHGWKVVPNAIPRVGGVVIDFAQTNDIGRPAVLPWVRSLSRREPHG